jgi:fumarylacetoacetase
LPYLRDAQNQKAGGLDIILEMYLQTAAMEYRVRLSRGNARDAYWTAAQLVAHHSSNGCNLRPGDLLGSGTLSGPTPDSAGSLMELTAAGKSRFVLPSGETRGFLENGDQVTQRGRCVTPGAISIGFGEAAGTILRAG